MASWADECQRDARRDGQDRARQLALRFRQSASTGSTAPARSSTGAAAPTASATTNSTTQPTHSAEPSRAG